MREKETFLKRTRNHLRFLIIKNLLFLKRFSIEDAIIISGEARGGTTWLSEIVSSHPELTVIWEPLMPIGGIVPKELHLGWRPYIPVADENSLIKKTFTSLLKGNLIKPWMTRKTLLKDFFQAKTLVFKFVRLNLSLPWLVSQYQFKHKPILILRHPFSVALSQTKAFGKMEHVENIFDPSLYNRSHYNEHAEFIKKLDGSLELAVAGWCLHHKPILDRLCSDQWVTVFYEYLVLNPEVQFENILRVWNVNSWKGFDIDYAKASSTDFKKDYSPNGEEQLNKWKNEIPKSQIPKLQSILDYFEIGLYSSGSIYPNVKPS